MTLTNSRLSGFASAHPVIFFITGTYLWTWGFWIPALHLIESPQGLKLALFLIGGFGPALAGVLTLRLSTGPREDGAMRYSGFLIGAVLAGAAVAIYRADLLGVAAASASGILVFPNDSPLYVYGLMGVVVALSGFVFASPQSRNVPLRNHFAGLVPDKRTLILAVPVLLFFPVLLVSSNALADVLGMSYEQPQYLRQAVSLWLPLMFVKMFTVAMLTGGNEEHGWRGVLLPLMQRSRSPLVATLIIVMVWELWHLPLVLTGVYGDGHPMIILAMRFLSTGLVAFLLTTIYNGTRGSIFLCILFHACLNSQINLFQGSVLGSVVGLLLVILLIFIHRMWRQGSGHLPTL